LTAPPSFLRLASQWLMAALLAVTLVALFVVLAGAQLTSEDAGLRVHRRSVATLTDIDATLPGIEAALDAAAEEPQATTVQVPFPIPVQLSAEEAATLRGPALRERILDESAALLYEDGMAEWAAADADSIQRIDRASTAGIMKTGLGMARDSRHTLFLAGTALLGVIALLLAIGMTIAIRDWNMRLVALGSVVFAAALPCLAAAIAVRFGFKTAQTEADPFVEALLDLGIDAMWVPIRDYLVLSSLGFAIAGFGALGAWLQARAPRRAVPAAPPAE
jgi:hypothetical protein